ncbi:hypothetical protein ACOJUR_15415 [Alicyclobacillus tolerans]|uniref:Uncharacterized protein n=1 Tax=Alicyclobacillus tolerans TaxID=90970 RepID=A0ABT9M072_9BACL|nr:MULTISPECIES: hypothetical protein [Alicyclobacillus]MDP9729925.1 hypothetical protein [Alicyclobacillus tengchongensis]QRF24918.1 hypothetical protein FY534_14185 [Alicyclobacillus sp. TC]
MEPLFTISSLHTVDGGSLAVMLVVQMVKTWPVFQRLPTRFLAVMVGEMLVIFTTRPLPTHVGGWTVLILNGVLLAATAVGGWHLVTKSVTEKTNMDLRG